MDGQKQALTPQRVLEELEAIGFARATEYLTEEGTLKNAQQLPAREAAAVASIETTKTGVKLKFYDKLKALELMGKHFGLFDGGGGESREESNLLEVLLAGTREEVDTDDLPELQ